MESLDIFIFYTTHKHVKCYTEQKIKFSVKDFFSKCDQTRSLLRIWSHSLKKSLMEIFIFCAVLLFEDKSKNPLQ